MANLPKRFLAEPTTFINVGDSVLPLASLPENISREFAVLDRMKGEMVDLAYKMEVLNLALRAKTQELGSAVAEHLKNAKPTRVVAEKSENPPPQELDNSAPPGPE